jgi:uncharacterized protein YggE
VNVRSLIIPLVAMAGLFAVACDEGDTIVHTTTQNVNGVSATGTGKAFGSPDVAVLTLGVQAERPNVEDAREAAAAAQKGVIDSLKANGVADKDIQTVQFSVNPRYSFGRDGGQTIIGYQVSNVITAKVRKLETTGKAIDDATRAGGNDAVVRNVAFTVHDPNELKKLAREEAVRLAREQAEQLARAAGSKLGALISISESGGFIPYESRGVATDAVAQVETPVEPGELEITVTVNLLFALDQ